VTIFSHLTGSACMVLAFNPEHSPGKPVAFETLIPNVRICTANWITSKLVGHTPVKEAINEIGSTFVERIGIPWTQEWHRRAIHLRYFQGMFV
jgi:hypothetical protein